MEVSTPKTERKLDHARSIQFFECSTLCAKKIRNLKANSQLLHLQQEYNKRCISRPPQIQQDVQYNLSTSHPAPRNLGRKWQFLFRNIRKMTETSNFQRHFLENGWSRNFAWQFKRSSSMAYLKTVFILLEHFNNILLSILSNSLNFD